MRGCCAAHIGADGALCESQCAAAQSAAGCRDPGPGCQADSWLGVAAASGGAEGGGPIELAGPGRPAAHGWQARARRREVPAAGGKPGQLTAQRTPSSRRPVGDHRSLLKNCHFRGASSSLFLLTTRSPTGNVS